MGLSAKPVGKLKSVHVKLANNLAKAESKEKEVKQSKK